VSVAAYQQALVERLLGVLGARLLGAYAAGSFGLEDFDPDRSDLDVFAVSREPVTVADKHAIVAALRNESLPCPAHGLEFVLYPERTARVASAEAGFVLNLNTGPQMAFRADEEPGSVERHWFPIDRAIVRTRGVALFGPPADELFAPIPRRLLEPVIVESLEWHLRDRESSADDAVLNACRSLLWLHEDAWSSKSEAGRWALDRVDDPGLVLAALRARAGRAQLDRGRVDHFVEAVLGAFTSVK
jgi:hypothetical protein